MRAAFVSVPLVMLAAAAAASSSGAGTDALAAAKPDLAVARIVVPPGGAATLEVRDVVRIRGRAKRSLVRYYLSRDRNRSREDRRLTGGRTVTARSKAGVVRLRVPTSIPRTSYFLVACADDAKRVRERNERNNCRASASRVTLLEPFRPSPLNVTETLDSARAVAAEIGPAGGTLTATAADGARLTFEVPAGALPIALQIRMTPLSGLAGLPAGGRLVAAARFEPEGLQLLKAATLTVDPARSVPIAQQLTFATEGGRDFHAYPMLPDRQAIKLPLLHFSTFGVSVIRVPETVTRRTPSSRIAWAEQNFAKAVREARGDERSGGERFASGAYVALYVLANESVGPLLREAVKNRSIRREAINAYLSWRRQADLAGVIQEAKLDKFNDEFEKLYETVLRQELEDVVSDCERGRTGPNAAHQILGMLRQTLLIGVIGDDEYAAAVNRMTNCLRFELTMTTTTTIRHSGEGADWVATTRARAAVIFPEALSAPLEAFGTEVSGVDPVCTAQRTATPTEPFVLTGLEMGIYLANEPVDPYFIVAAFQPGRLDEPFTISCPDESWTMNWPIYRNVIDFFHTPTSYRVTDWQRVPGSLWAFERRFGPRAGQAFDSEGTAYSYEEETRFFLRHAPASR